MEVLKKRDPFKYLIEPSVDSVPVPPEVLERIKDNKIQIRLNLLFAEVQKTLLCDGIQMAFLRLSIHIWR